MGLFNKNNNEDELITILGEIRDNLKIDNSTVVNELESKIADAHYNNDEEIGVMSNRLNHLENKVEKLTTLATLQDKTIDKLEELVKKQDESINVLVKSNKVVLGILSDVCKPKNEKKGRKKRTIKKGEKYTRHYSASIIKQAPHPVKLKSNGKFILASGKESTWNIHNLLKLKKLIPTELNMTEIAEKVGIGTTTANYLCYSIEAGIFDKFFNEWEQIQADKMYKKDWKPILENNPEKRKEKGYC